MKSLGKNVTLLFLVIITIIACNKDNSIEPDNTDNNTETPTDTIYASVYGINLSIGKTSNLTYNSVRITGDIKSFNPSSPVVQHGHCWAKSNNPTINDSKTELGPRTGAGIYQSELTNLESGTTYFVKAYFTNENGATSYHPSVVSFRTTELTAPVIKTGNPSSQTESSFIISGIVETSGGSMIVQYGHCWSNINSIPTTADEKNQLGNLEVANFNYSSTLSNLTPSTVYFVRAYAKNSFGTSYGNIVQVTTNNIAGTPIVKTDSISISTAQVYGTLLNLGNTTEVSEHGFVYSSDNSLPDINSTKLNLGTRNTTGRFNGTLSNLIGNTSYNIRAYARNENGISYGTNLQFITVSNIAGTPIVKTDSISNIQKITAQVYGTLLDLGNTAKVSEHGFVYSSDNSLPDINSTKLNLGTKNTTGNFNGTLSNLIENTSYNIRAYARNENGISYGDNLQFMTTMAVPVSEINIENYCTLFGSNSTDEWINKVSIGNFQKVSGNDNGYAFHEDEIIFLSSGSNNLQLFPEYSGGQYNEYWRVWIDYNQNSNFEFSELVYSSNNGSIGEINVTINLSDNDIIEGTTIMRIAMKWVGTLNDGTNDLDPPNSCGNFNFGEVEDYRVHF